MGKGFGLGVRGAIEQVHAATLVWRRSIAWSWGLWPSWPRCSVPRALRRSCREPADDSRWGLRGVRRAAGIFGGLGLHPHDGLANQVVGLLRTLEFVHRQVNDRASQIVGISKGRHDRARAQVRHWCDLLEDVELARGLMALAGQRHVNVYLEVRGRKVTERTFCQTIGAPFPRLQWPVRFSEPQLLDSCTRSPVHRTFAWRVRAHVRFALGRNADTCGRSIVFSRLYLRAAARTGIPRTCGGNAAVSGQGRVHERAITLTNRRQAWLARAS